MTTTRGLASK